MSHVGIFNYSLSCKFGTVDFICLFSPALGFFSGWLPSQEDQDEMMMWCLVQLQFSNSLL